MKLVIAADANVKNPKTLSGAAYSLYCTLEKSDRLSSITDIDLSAVVSERDRKINYYKNLDFAATFKTRQPITKAGAAVNNIVNSCALNKILPTLQLDALLQIGGFRVDNPDLPYYIYHDATHDMTLDYYRSTGELPYHFKALKPDYFERASSHVRGIYENASGIFCISRWMAEIVVNTTGIAPEKVHTVYAAPNFHGFELPQDIPAKMIGDESAPVTIAFVGVNYEEKGCDQLVEAVKLLNRQGSRIYSLVIAGLSPENLPKEAKDDANIIIRGFLDKPSLFKMLTNAELFVLPSRFDFFGMAFIEAMLLGLPCIGRNICAMPEIIDEGVNGELVKDNDPQSLADLIVKITGNRDQYAEYSRQALEKSSRFSWEKTAGKMLDVICKGEETASK